MRQLSAVLRIETKSVFCELRLLHLTRAAIFAVHRSLYDHARRVLVRCLRNFEMHIAVGGVYARFLHERIGHVKHLELAAGPRSIGSYESVLRPAQDCVDTDFLGGDVGDGDVLGNVAEIRDVWLNGEALAEIFGRRLQNSVIAALAGSCGKP